MVTWRVQITDKKQPKHVIKDYLVQYDESYTAKDIEEEAKNNYCLQTHSKDHTVEIIVTKA